MFYSNAYKPQRLIGRPDSGESLDTIDKIRNPRTSAEMQEVYLDELQRKVQVMQKQIKELDQFYKVFRMQLSDALDTETSLNRKNFGTEAGLRQARDILDNFYYSNKYQEEFDKKKVASFAQILENLEILEKDNPDNNLRARIEIIKDMIRDVTKVQEQLDIDTFDPNDVDPDSGFSYRTRPEIEVQDKIRVMGHPSISKNLGAMLPDVLYIEAPEADRLYAKFKAVTELPRDIKEIGDDVLYILCDEDLDDPEINVITDLKDMKDGLNILVEETPDPEEVL